MCSFPSASRDAYPSIVRRTHRWSAPTHASGTLRKVRGGDAGAVVAGALATGAAGGTGASKAGMRATSSGVRWWAQCSKAAASAKATTAFAQPFPVVAARALQRP